MRKFKRGDVVKLNETGKMADNKEIENKLFEIESIVDEVQCYHRKEKRCRGVTKCNIQEGQGVFFTDYNSRCSEVLEFATDREAFLYHVVGLRERIE